MVITLLIHPVREFGHVVHRCVVRYDRDAIVKARQAAGLAVNLDRREETAMAKAPTSVQIAPLQKTTPEKVAPSTPISQSTQNTESPLSGPPASAKEPDRAVAANIAAVSSTPKLIVRTTEIKTSKWDKRAEWSKPLHGLKVAAQARVINANRRQALVSVQNILPTPINIAPAQPELSIQTLDDRDRILQVEPVKSLEDEGSNAHGLIAPGATAVYLITYETPVLGAKQRLCVAVAQSAAADEPVMIELTREAR
jgi:hypothetical protein